MTTRNLTGMAARDAAERWFHNKPCTLRQFAAAMGLTYTSAWTLSRKDGFPRIGRLIFREDFEAWRRRLAKQCGRPSQPVRPPECADRSDEPTAMSDSPTPWPRRAARLRAITG